MVKRVKTPHGSVVCLQFVLSFIYSREGLTRLDAFIYLTETPDDLHLTSLPFQVLSLSLIWFYSSWFDKLCVSLRMQALFSNLQQLAIIAGDVLLGKEKLQKILLARLTEMVIIWLSNEQKFWSAFEDESTPLQPFGLQRNNTLSLSPLVCASDLTDEVFVTFCEIDYTLSVVVKIHHT